MPNKKIALFAQTLNLGGSTRMLLVLAKGFADRGYSVDVLLASANGEMKFLVPENVRLIDFEKKRTLLTLPQLINYMRREKPIAMYCQVGHTGIVALIAIILSMSKISIIITIRNTTSIASQELPIFKRRILSLMTRFLFPYAKKIITVSEGVAEDLIKTTKLPRRNITVIYNPVVTKRLKSEMHKSVDHPWFVQKRKPIVLAAGRLIPQKDFETLIRAFHKVTLRFDAYLIIIGEGGQKEMLTKLVHELGLNNNVDLPGFIKNPYAYMKHSDLFVLSSRFEGFGNVIVEAMACGCPVVSTDCPSGPNEILDNGRFGKLVPLNNSNSLAEAIIWSLSEEHNIPNIQERAEYFSDDRIVNEYLSLLE